MLLKKINEFYKVWIHCSNLSPFHSIFMVRRSGIICSPIWGLFPVRGSFAVQFGDHFRSGDHLQFNLGIISRPGIICSSIWASFPVRGSFAVQFGDHFRSGDHLRAGIICGPVSLGELMTRIDVKILACSLKGSHLRSVISFTIFQYRWISGIFFFKQTLTIKFLRSFQSKWDKMNYRKH